VKASGSVVRFVLLLAVALIGWAHAAAAQSPTDLTGSWTLNRVSSQFPDEIGFSTDPFGGVPGARGGTGTGRGGRRGGGGSRSPEGLRGPLLLPETQEDAQRRRFLTDEARLPPERLTIAVTPATVTVTPEPGAARTVVPGRRDESVTIGSMTVTTTATWEAERRLTVAYTAEAGRVVRYTFEVTPSPRQLVVDIEFVGRGGGDKVRRIYDPAPSGQPADRESNRTSEPSANAAAPLPRLALPPGALPPGARPPASSVPAAAAAAIDQRPDAPLRGLGRLGLVIEGVDAEAAKCGLKPDALEPAVSKRLTDAGFRVLRDTDDETYLYVNVNAVTASAGLCVTRYDVTLYSHAAAPLAHTSAPVDLQVELLHKGGLAGGAPAQNGEAVTKNVLDYVDQFATRIKNANK
jgi:hypothetical protein